MTRRSDIVLDAMTDLIMVVKANGEFCWISPSCHEILGYRQSEMIGKNAVKFIYPLHLESVRAEMRLSRLGHETRKFECSYVRKDGSLVTLQWSGNWSEPLQQHIFNGRDVTEMRTQLALKATEAQLISIHEYLSKHRRRQVLRWWAAFEVMLILGSMWGSYVLLTGPSNFESFPESYRLAKEFISDEWKWGLIAGVAALVKTVGLLGIWFGYVNTSFVLSLIGLLMSGLFWIFMGVSYFIGNPDSLFVMTGGILFGTFAFVAAIDRLFR